MKRIGLFVGNKMAPNVYNFLKEFGKLFSDKFSLDLIGSFESKKRLDRLYDGKYSEFGVAGLKGIGRIKHAIRNCNDYIKSENPDVIMQITRPFMYGWAVSGLCNLMDVPFVMRLTGDSFREYQYVDGGLFDRTKKVLTHNLLSRYTLKSSDKVIALTSYLKSVAVNHGCNKSKISIIPQFVGDEFYPVSESKKLQLRGEMNLPKDRKISLTVGRVSREKGIEEIRDVSNKLPKVTFLLVGEKKIDFDFSNNVIVWGEVNHDEVHKFYQTSDFLLHPSKFEGLPTVFLEAFKCDLPIISREKPYNKGLNLSYKYTSLDDLTQYLKKNIDLIPEVHSLGDEIETDKEVLKQQYLDLFDSVILEFSEFAHKCDECGEIIMGKSFSDLVDNVYEHYKDENPYPEVNVYCENKDDIENWLAHEYRGD